MKINIIFCYTKLLHPIYCWYKVATVLHRYSCFYFTFYDFQQFISIII